jgi:hypothetical protein
VLGVIGDAVNEVDYYLYPRYDVDSSQYANNPWVKAAATAAALVLLFKRRGNPVPRVFLWRWTDPTAGFLPKLQRVLDGQAVVPRLQLRKGEVPVMTNIRTRLWPYPQALAERKHSTGTPQGYTQQDDSVEPPPLP